MYGLKWKVLTSWSRFSTRETTDMHPHRETPISMICHRGVILVKTISYMFTSLVACHVMTHQPLYFIMQCTWTMVTWHDDSSRRNLFLEDYPISASLFVFRGSNTKLFFAICLLYFRDMLWHHRNIRTHLTTNTRPPNDITSFAHLLCSHTCIPPHSTWHHDTLPHIGHAPCDWSPALVAHMKSYSFHLTSPSLRSSARTLGHACLYKGLICTCQPWYC